MPRLKIYLQTIVFPNLLVTDLFFQVHIIGTRHRRASGKSLGQRLDSGYATSVAIGWNPFQAPRMSATLIAVSLLLLIILAVAALFKAGSDSKTSNDDDPRL